MTEPEPRDCVRPLPPVPDRNLLKRLKAAHKSWQKVALAANGMSGNFDGDDATWLLWVFYKFICDLIPNNRLRLHILRHFERQLQDAGGFRKRRRQ